MKKLNQKGFGVSGILIIIVVLGLIGAVSFYVYNANKDSKNATNQNQSTNQANNSAKPESKTEERKQLANGKASIILPSGWKVVSEKENCKLSTDAVDPAAPAVSCLAQLDINPADIAERLAVQVQTVGEIMVVSSPAKTPLELLNAMSGVCSSTNTKDYQVASGYEASYCASEAGGFSNSFYAVRKGENFVYLSMKLKIPAGAFISDGDGNPANDKKTESEDFSKYTSSFESIVKSVKF